VGLLTHLGKMVKAFGKAVRKQRLRRIWRDADLHRQTLLEDTAPSRVDGLELKSAEHVPDENPKLVEGAHSLIGADNAAINPKKLTEYALNPDHPVGGHKARVFKSALGFDKSNADDLMTQLKQGVKTNTPIPGKVDQYGERFTVEIPVVGPTGEGIVKSGWIYKPGSNVPELTTILVKKG
ncbi:DUF6883 domain-containing protein, partial [Marinobacter halodurans]|uniref:DUF6883 domain-containing protein n=1 Tax=Marinobacter halodurans TaxID=2528979 RepID=UPI001A9556E8